MNATTGLYRIAFIVIALAWGGHGSAQTAQPADPATGPEASPPAGEREAVQSMPPGFAIELLRQINDSIRELGGDARDLSASLEHDMRNLNMPLPESEVVVSVQQQIDERIGYMAYQTEALKRMTELETAAASYRKARADSRLQSLQTYIAVVQELERNYPTGQSKGSFVDLRLASVTPREVALSSASQTYVLRVSSRGSPVRFSEARLVRSGGASGMGGGTLRVVPGDRGECIGRVLEIQDECVVRIEWSGSEGAIAGGVLELEFNAELDLLGESVHQVETVHFSPLTDVGVENGNRELADKIKDDMTALIGDLSSTVSVLHQRVNSVETIQADVLLQEPEGASSTSEAIANALDLRMGLHLGSIEARLSSLEDADEETATGELSMLLDAGAAPGASLPSRMHLVSAQGAGEHGVAKLEILPEPTQRAGGGRQIVRLGDVVGDGWSVEAIEPSMRRVILVHREYGRAMILPRVFTSFAALQSASALASGPADAGLAVGPVGAGPAASAAFPPPPSYTVIEERVQ